jgi:hypothetical protein
MRSRRHRARFDNRQAKELRKGEVQPVSPGILIRHSFRRQRFRHVGNKVIDLLFGCGPGAHQSVNVWLNELVKTPAAIVQLRYELLRQAQEHGTRVAREGGLGPQRSHEFPREQSGTFV